MSCANTKFGFVKIKVNLIRLFSDKFNSVLSFTQLIYKSNLHYGFSNSMLIQEIFLRIGL